MSKIPQILIVGVTLALAHGPAKGAQDWNGFASRLASQTASPNFKTSQRIDAARMGLVGDGRTDNTAVLQKLLGDGNRTIHIPAGDYVTGKLEIPKNTVLLLDPGVVLRDSGKLGPYDRFINILSDNVYIKGQGAKVLANRNSYQGGEQRHGIFIFGASNVVIDGLDSSGTSGDGFYIGGPRGKPPQHVVLENCSAGYNRRQGLSITSGRDIDVVNCVFSHTRGTAPQFGVDIEPNDPSNPLDGIRLIGVRTEYNYGGGISVYLGSTYTAPGGAHIAIIGHESVGEAHRYQVVGPHGAGRSITYKPAR
jgi:Right handed beta helix region